MYKEKIAGMTGCFLLNSHSFGDITYPKGSVQMHRNGGELCAMIFFSRVFRSHFLAMIFFLSNNLIHFYAAVHS